MIHTNLRINFLSPTNTGIFLCTRLTDVLTAKRRRCGQRIGRCVVMYDAPLFLFITTQIGSFSLSRDLLKISLIHVFPASKNSSCKLIKQSNQPIHTFFSHFCTLICPNTASGSMHLCPLCLSPSSEQSSSLAFCLYFLSL